MWKFLMVTLIHNKATIVPNGGSRCRPMMLIASLCFCLRLLVLGWISAMRESKIEKLINGTLFTLEWNCLHCCQFDYSRGKETKFVMSPVTPAMIQVGWDGEVLKASTQRTKCVLNGDPSFEENTDHGDHHGTRSPGTHRPPIVNGRTQEGWNVS